MQEILAFIEGRVKGKRPDYKMETNVFYEILQNKDDKFEDFRKDIKKKWEVFKSKTQNKVIKRTYTGFLYENFDRFFQFFTKEFFGINENSLEIIIKEKISDRILFLEYKFSLNSIENNLFKAVSENSEGNLSYIFSFPTGYLYLIIRLLGILIRKIIQENLFILMDGIILRKRENFNDLNFIVIVKDSKDEIFECYYDMVLYYFLKYFKGIPDEYYQKLLKGRERLYEIALDEYGNSKEKLVDLLYYFYRKCKLLESFSPLLDFFNFVCSRVEDSIFSKIDIIEKDFLDNMDYSLEKKNAIIKFFNFLDRNSTLYATFQANNLPSSKAQLNLFLLYMKYYFGSGLETLEIGDLLFLPEIFKTALNQYNRKMDNVINAKSIKNIALFSNFLSNISNVDNIDIFFQKIFGKKVSQLNYRFFRTFLKSFNANFMNLIESQNEVLVKDPNNITFNFDIIVDHICRILYVLISKIFFRNNPNDASINFIDPRSRYIGKNIALRVLELFIFQDINYSDDVWPDYIISLNKEQLKKNLKKFNIRIQEKYFYTAEDLTQIMGTYNIQSFTDQPLFEDWLFNDIILPINNFILRVNNSVKDPSNEIEVLEKLKKLLISDKDRRRNAQILEILFKQFAIFWKKFE